MFENNRHRPIELFALLTESGIMILPFRDAASVIIMQGNCF